MSDMLNITETQARVLRAVAYYESDSGKKGATQYTCSRKVPNGLHVSGSTFNDNIKDLEKNLMVFRLEGKKDGNKETKPYTITDIGQVAWLRYFTLPDNIEIIQKIFPNIQLSVVDDIINEIQHPLMKKIKNNYSIWVLGIALNSFHIEAPSYLTMDYVKMGVQEIIELSGGYGLVKTSFSRHYDIIHPSFKKNNRKIFGGVYFLGNFDDLEISVMDRITFLFYYNLVQSILESTYALKIIMKIILDNKTDRALTMEDDGKKLLSVLKSSKKEFISSLDSVSTLSLKIPKKKKEIMKKIFSNETITKIIQDNLKNLKEYKSNDNDFQNISQIFLKN